MGQGTFFQRFLMSGVLAIGIFSACGTGFAQAKSGMVSDAQVEANVLKALAGAPQLADQAITTTTVYGTVTLSGTVRDEASRDMAEKLVSNAPGVKKVVDELTIGTGSTPDNTAPMAQDQQGQGVGTNPNLQSDGTVAPPPPGEAPPPPGVAPPPGEAPPPPGDPQSYPNQMPEQSSYAPMPGQAPPPNASSAPPYGGGQPGQYPGDGPQNRQPYPPPYGSPNNGRPNSAYSQHPYVEQKGGDPVVVPSGTLLRVRVNQGMDSKHTSPGTVFDGIVLSDVIAGGSVAIPRGATVQGIVADVHNGGQLKGKGGLALHLTQVSLGGKVYPLASDMWSQQGADKTGQTVGNTVGLGAVGALIGAVAGGGAGAAVGAGVGAVAGLGVSSASGRGDAVLPAEAILVFHLTQPTELTTVSQAELNRLGTGVPLAGQQPQMRRRYPPPPQPYYYGPAYYPRY